MQLIVEKKGHRVLPLLALAIAIGLVLLVAVIGTQAGHTAGLIELDVTTTGCPTPGGGGNPTPLPSCGNANTENDAIAGTDWDDVCSTFSDEGLTPPTPPDVPQTFFANDIVTDATLPTGIDVATCDRDYFKPDQSYFASNKDIEDVAPAGVDTWGCVEQSNPLAKDEILNGYAAKGAATIGTAEHDILYFGFERDSNNGTAFQGFWFLQNPTGCTHAGSGTTSFAAAGSSPHASATPTSHGDILALVNYTGGGRVASMNVVEWDLGSGACQSSGALRVATNLCLLFTGADCSVSAPDDQGCAVVNGINAINPGDPTNWNNHCNAAGSNKCATGSAVALGTNQFFEGSLDLTALLCTFGGVIDPTCTVPCFSTFLAETRSSAEFTATLKDYVKGEFNTCSSAITVQKEDPDGNLLPGACYTITNDDTGVEVSVCDGSAPDEADGNDGVVCVDGLGSGDYTITETTAPPGYIGDPISKSVTIPTPLLTNTECPKSGDPDAVFVNTLGSLAWEKRSDIDGSLLAGATFTVGGATGPFACHVPSDSTNPITVVDNGTNDSDPDDGQFLVVDVCIGTYTITETVAPTGFGIDPDATRDCTVSASGADCVVGTQDQADNCPDSNDGSDTDEEDFCNVVGSLAWEKRSVKSGNPFVGGATFTVDDGTTTRTVTDCTASPCSGEDQDADAGQFCVDQVILGTLITVTETVPPDNYVHDPNDDNPKTVTLNSSSTCATASVSFVFYNIPLSEIEVQFRSLVPGATAAWIDCSPAGDTTEEGAADPAFDDTDETFTNLVPGTYNCTVEIDP